MRSSRTAKKSAERAFWDASGVVLLAISQPDSVRAHHLRRATGPLVVWWGTGVECQSALHRLAREGQLDAAGLAAGAKRVGALLAEAYEVEPTDEVRERANALLAAHTLRAGDALQLAAAISSARGHPRGRVLVCFDAKLATAARALGFDVRP